MKPDLTDDVYCLSSRQETRDLLVSTYSVSFVVVSLSLAASQLSQAAAQLDETRVRAPAILRETSAGTSY